MRTTAQGQILLIIFLPGSIVGVGPKAHPAAGAVINEHVVAVLVQILGVRRQTIADVRQHLDGHVKLLQHDIDYPLVRADQVVQPFSRLVIAPHTQLLAVGNIVAKERYAGIIARHGHIVLRQGFHKIFGNQRQPLLRVFAHGHAAFGAEMVKNIGQISANHHIHVNVEHLGVGVQQIKNFVAGKGQLRKMLEIDIVKIRLYGKFIFRKFAGQNAVHKRFVLFGKALLVNQHIGVLQQLGIVFLQTQQGHAQSK